MIYLIGFMASGKSTLGQALADACPGVRYVDLDAAVEAEAGCSIPEYFGRYGVASFRELESRVLRTVAQPRTVVACGGGTPCFGDNMDYMLATGTVVRLQADTDTIMRRVQLQPGQRPILAALEDNPEALRRYIDRLKADREPSYCRAHCDFDANRLDDREQIEESVRTFIERFKDKLN